MDNHHFYRNSNRLANYDYSQNGAYFVTLVTYNRQCYLAAVVDGNIELSPEGMIVKKCWEEIQVHYPMVITDQFVIMPNHFHGIIFLIPVEQTHAFALRRSNNNFRTHGPLQNSLGSIIGNFKSVVSKRIHELHNLSLTPIWQPNYYDHIIRDEKDLDRIRKYIFENPFHWDEDDQNTH